MPSRPVMPPHHQFALAGNEFDEQYRESIKPVVEMIDKHISRATWRGMNF
jgi:hypothetical protein